jgi:hypothetical protein
VFVKNRGIEMGVTLQHPPSQIYGQGFLPQRQARSAEVLQKHYSRTGRNLLADLAVAERAERQGMAFALSQSLRRPDRLQWRVALFARHSTGTITPIRSAQPRRSNSRKTNFGKCAFLETKYLVVSLFPRAQACKRPFCSRFRDASSAEICPFR